MTYKRCSPHDDREAGRQEGVKALEERVSKGLTSFSQASPTKCSTSQATQASIQAFNTRPLGPG